MLKEHLEECRDDDNDLLELGRLDSDEEDEEEEVDVGDDPDYNSGIELLQLIFIIVIQ